MEVVHYKIKGMSCAGCAANIEREVSKLEGVSQSSVNYAVESGKFELESPEIEFLVRSKISELGFSIAQPSDADEKDSTTGNNFSKFITSLILAILIFALAMWPLMGWPSKQVNWYLQLVLCVPIWGWIGLKFQKSLLMFFKSGQSNMNTLIGLGTTSAFIYSAFLTLFTEYSIQLGMTQKVYFEAVGFIISFVYLGQYFEGKAKRKTKEALNSLLQLSTKKATVVTGEEVKEVDLAEVEIGDILRVKTGEKFPVDGTITKGSTLVDEAMISGEPLPVPKEIGSKVLAGTINEDQIVEYKATRVGSDTFLAQIIRFVEDAQSSKPEIQKYADKVSGIFTPVVMIISVVTFLLWFLLGPEPVWGNSISNFIAVLVIACPCALGLATPTAVVVATGRASLKGLLIGGGDVIEKAIGVDVIIFDKTGTITEGKPTVTKLITSVSEKELLRDVGSIEQFSEHPLSKAIVKYTKEREISLSEPDDFEVVKGKGLLASINGKKYIIGNKKLLADKQVKLEERLESSEVGSFVFIAIDNLHVATMIIGDKIKKTSKQAISDLKDLGIETWMITGDNEAVARNVKEQLGIDHYIAEALPLDKAKKVEELQKEGKVVAMVGDGVNDAPALAKANLSLAMGTGTDVAMNASDVTIVKGDLSMAVEFISLSEGTMKIIKQNLFLSMIYNSLLIPIAAGALVLFGGPMMPPVLASVAMALSSISVVSNSLRIRKLI